MTAMMKFVAVCPFVIILSLTMLPTSPALQAVEGMQPVTGIVHVLSVTLACVIQIQGLQTNNRIFLWSHNAENYVTKDKSLSGYSFYVTNPKFLVNQCAMECLRNSMCKSFNYNRATFRCDLNRASHTDFPGNVVDLPNWEYHAKEAYSIDPEALGPCASKPCGENGQCIETRNNVDDLVAICLCHQNWTGTTCQLQASAPQWAAWSEWGQCSVSCSHGWRMRTRKCEDTTSGTTISSLECYGADIDYSVCIWRECPKWDQWGQWEECSASRTCGLGTKVRRRTCSNGGVPGIDRYCLGSTNETVTCYGINCNGIMALKDGVEHGEGRLEIFNDLTKEWGLLCADQMTPTIADLICSQLGYPGAYTAITDGRYGIGSVKQYAINALKCAGGEKRILECQHSTWALNSTCTGQNSTAASVQCNVNGVWSLWASWSHCSVSCENGIQVRKRICNHPAAMHAGKPCEGEVEQFKPCQLEMCPVDGAWRSWSDWTVCSASCGNGTQQRTRTCRGPFFGGRNCTGPDSESRQCSIKNCAVDGVWQQWNEWGVCSLTCGNGTRSRNRTCVGPFYNGQNCSGSSVDWDKCNDFNCPVDGEWFPWQQWQACSVTCGGGQQTRVRTCNNPVHGGLTCIGVSKENRTCGNTSCPIDGVWFNWSAWSTCSVTCGNGTQSRNRTCNGPFHGGADCVGDSKETQLCQPKLCPVDGVWQSWAAWSVCSHTCGNGTRTRTRSCDGPKYGGANCTGVREENEYCNLRSCAVDGVIGEWTSWSECSLSCSKGQRSRSRNCNGPYFGGAPCLEILNETEACNENPCPLDGIFSNWTGWTECDVTCGGGFRSRNRTCIGPFFGGANCSGDLQQQEECNTYMCPVDGVWAQWGSWGDCNVTCNGGVQMRQRTCLGPLYSGQNCQGVTSDSQVCNTHSCPVDGVWAEWGSWGDCNVTCNGGVQLRQRTCLGPFNGGQVCQGVTTDIQTCNLRNCSVDGVWAEWGSWGDCNVICNGGVQLRQRTCLGPFNGGQVCQGVATASQACNTHSCPVDGVYNEWSTWSGCSLTCGNGSQWRSRLCTGPFYGGADCVGPANESRHCNDQHCPVDGALTDWLEWSKCTTTCGGGSRQRTRTCNGPFYGGNDCLGSRTEVEVCNAQFCPVDGVYREWATWGDCSKTCGGGSQLRNRVCNEPLYGGQNCQGPANETQSCNTQQCPVDAYYHDWSSWGECSTSCGGGTQTRSRVCEPPRYGGLDCQGPANNTQECNTQPCPIDGVWSTWSSWSNCNVTCGGGLRERVRTCVEPKYGGAPCAGDKAEHLGCASNLCPIPGVWNPWSPWTVCTTTCGGGKQERSRVCNMTSYGNLTAPCLGNPHEVADCHTFPCIPYARTCSEWAKKGLTISTPADVDPDGDGELVHVRVYCDMQTKEGVTVIGHNGEERTKVQGYEGAREYYNPIEYNISIDHVLSIIDQSAFCSQFIRWECKAAIIHNYLDNNKINTGWINRTLGVADYFGGADPGSNKCACGMTNSCSDPMQVCNCDSNDDLWREDSGNLTYKEDLPVMAFVAGDTGDLRNEMGYHTVGRLLCYGYES